MILYFKCISHKETKWRFIRITFLFIEKRLIAPCDALLPFVNSLSFTRPDKLRKRRKEKQSGRVCIIFPVNSRATVVFFGFPAKIIAPIKSGASPAKWRMQGAKDLISALFEFCSRTVHCRRSPGMPKATR